MPARELGSSFDAPNGVQLLRKHKVLPHPGQARLPELYPSTPAPKPRDLVIDTGIPSIPSSATSSPHTLKHASKKIGGLPSPPHSRQSSGSHSINASRYDVASSKNSGNIPSIPSTPPNQKSPPTPDVTPPRPMPLAFRPPASDRYPSSRTDSFKTAPENPYSSDEDEVSTVRPGLASVRQSALEVPQFLGKPHKRKEVGLGLGLESDNEGTTTPRAESPQPEFNVFDGEWGSETSEVEREWDHNLMRNVTVRKRPGRRLHMFTEEANEEVIEDDLVSPTNATKVVRTLPLHEKIPRHRLEREADRLPKETKRATSSPLVRRDIELPKTPDIRRLSAMSGRSGTSAVVEAIVVDAPPTRRKTLRHTKKQLGLRDFSSDQSTLSSTPNSVVSTSLSSELHRDSRHRLHHSAGKIPETRHRSLASNVTVSTASSSGRSRREVLKSGGIPVVVIPERRSSAKSSKEHSLRSTSSHKSKRSNSLTSAPLSQSSKFNGPGYMDSVAPRKRTMSESAGDRESIRTIDFPPNIPARRSSLSAPTSRNTSRAGSLTAESLKAHNMIQAKKHEAPEPMQLHTAGSQKDLLSPNRLNVDHNGDPFFGNRLSTQVTPFSQVSYETAGTSVEVSNAMAVSIFPHQNKSVLVVQQTAPPESSSSASKSIGAAEPEPPTLTLNDRDTGRITPRQPIHRMDEVDSPLRNPRAPPEPPKIAFIPPTPVVLTPGQEEDRQLGYTLDEPPVSSDSKSKRGLSLVRRAFSNRRNSESTINHRPGLLKRTLSLSGRRKDLANKATQQAQGNAITTYPSVVDQPADDSKLHPFWRPSHFWDDLDNDFADDELVGGYPMIDNRPSPPKRSLSGKLKRTFAILPIQDDFEHQPYSMDRREMRRGSSGDLRVVKQRSNSSLRREAYDRRQYVEVPEGTFGHGFKNGNGGRSFHTIPGLGVRVEYVGWSGMKRRLSEKRRRQRSEKLRATISTPRQVQSGVDDVLRQRRGSQI
ncbi:hypothetical protein LHYA1_G001009 [Lachnellula hyalina]|uniref:Uncharacterized protein n=1 Tax=Lachnellula hyalina TaxID=1316788 RepID=A0A8H8R710_9HELO|nr:uncharacterized protein LHYA1_G001009 [Lachnellula hyalina]TVY29629.1 hypothetical protein LHYA1_G001009 [Lachnellula hyalina]